MNKSNSNGGRKQGNTNKYTLESRKILLDVLGQDYINRLDKLLNPVDMDKKLNAIKPFIKILCSIDDEIGKETRIKIFEGFKDQLYRNKLRSYFSLLSEEKKLTELRQWIQMLSPEEIEELFKNLKQQGTSV